MASRNFRNGWKKKWTDMPFRVRVQEGTGTERCHVALTPKIASLMVLAFVYMFIYLFSFSFF